MKIKYNFISIIGIVALACAANAEVKPSAMFTDNMVLQHGKPVNVWGIADKGERVSVSFAGQKVNAVADKAGVWTATLQPMAINKDGAEMVIKGENTVKLGNILVGDVWVCSGQSNMEMPFEWVVLNNEAEKKDADNYPLIRHIKIERLVSAFPVKNPPARGPWKVCNYETLNGVTTTGYFFAKEIFKETGIPIGIIDVNWSGCRIEPFIAPEGLYAIPQLKKEAEAMKSGDISGDEGRALYSEKFKKAEEWAEQAEAALKAGSVPYDVFAGVDHNMAFFNNRAPGGYCTQYFAMVAPLTQFSVKGAIWYQGESNHNESESYYNKMEALIEGWRRAWNDDYPFYWVQLSSFQQQTNTPEGDKDWPYIREAQRKAINIPGTGMAVSIDIGNANDIHPKNKQDIGKRLALWALNFDYGKKSAYSGPIYKDVKIEGDKLRVSFDHSASGLMVGNKEGLEPVQEVAGGKLGSFAVAGADKQWRWAEAVIDGDTVLVSSAEVKNPVAVRYAFRKNPGKDANLYNKDGLPASPFRSDDW